MNVLVACEESQAVCKAFRQRGHNAYTSLLDTFLKRFDARADLVRMG